MQTAPDPASFSALLNVSMAAASLDCGSLSERIGVDQTYLMHMLAGRRTPETRVLNLLCDALGWTPEQTVLALHLVSADKQARRAAAAAADEGEA